MRKKKNNNIFKISTFLFLNLEKVNKMLGEAFAIKLQSFFM